MGSVVSYSVNCASRSMSVLGKDTVGQCVQCAGLKIHSTSLITGVSNMHEYPVILRHNYRGVLFPNATPHSLILNVAVIAIEFCKL